MLRLRAAAAAVEESQGRAQLQEASAPAGSSLLTTMRRSLQSALADAAEQGDVLRGAIVTARM